MLLTCDIGNSHISFGIFEGQTLKDNFEIPTNKQAATEELLQLTKGHIKVRYSIDELLIASVVPELTQNLAQSLKLLFELEPRILANKDIPIVNEYSEPEKVGVDRLLNAYAGVKLFKAPLIIIDFGTATTFDVVSKEGAYSGGAIVPGVETSLEALFGKASRLNAVELKKPSESVGHSTEESIRSGVVIGTAGLVDKMVTEIENDLGPSTHIATGGLASLIIPYCETVDIIESYLTLKAIAMLAP